MPDGLSNHLVVFAKAPVMGRVKSRLAADIGQVAATRFYRATLGRLLRRLGRDPRWHVWLAVTPDSAATDTGLWLGSADKSERGLLRFGSSLCLPSTCHPRFRGNDKTWQGGTDRVPYSHGAISVRPTQPLPAGVRLIPQGPGGLGARMARMLAPPPFGPPPGPVVLIGSDIPGIRPRHIETAFTALGRHALVFGPAVDGGFWLVGARRRPTGLRDLFHNVRWSTEHALADTLVNIGPGNAAGFLETLDDIDDGRAYARLFRP